MTEKKQSKVVQVINEFVAGSIGGMCGVATGHPMDTIRVRLQTQSRTNPQFSSFFDCLKQTIAKERGIKGLYKGMFSPLIGEMGNLAILFGVYGNIKPHLPQEGITGVAVSGSVAGFANSLLVSPVELIKIRLQINTKQFQGFTSCLKETVNQPGGVRNLYHGFCSTLAREVPFNFIYFMSYEKTKEFLSKRRGELGPVDYMLSGGLAGTMAWAVSYPFDIVKSNIQANHGKLKIKDAFAHILKTEGWRGLFVGYAPSVIRAFPVNAATFLGYEFVIKLLNGN